MINRLRQYEPQSPRPEAASASAAMAEKLHVDQALKFAAGAIARNPAATLAGALFVGVTAGWLLKRR